MAILKCFLGVEVEILVDGKALKEYHDRDLKDEPRTITRYIEAKSDQKFAISVKILPNFKFKGNVLSSEVLVDGQKTSGTCLSRQKERSRPWINEGPDTKTGFRALLYCFSSLETVHDGQQKKGEFAKLKDLGSIVIQCGHLNLKGRARVMKRSQFDTQGPGMVSEKALKGQAISHNVSYVAATRKQPKQMGRSFTLVPGQPEVGATFVFRYRSLDALKSMLIIPRTPSPPPLEYRDSSSLNKDEVKRLQDQLVELKKWQEAQMKVKLEPGDDNPRTRKVARPSAGATQLEIDDSGRVRESSTGSLPPAEKVGIELD